jgi:hypothetical protein
VPTGDQPDDQPDDQAADQAADEAADRYVAALIARGEAAEPDEHGELPEGATHELYTDEQGRQRVRRRQFF